EDLLSETMQALTNPGTVMGTVGYMSPEQVRGQVVDHRCDIFAFGAILYEMVSGRRAFEGASSVETMSAILRDEPPSLSQINLNLNPALERILRHCLEKNADDRFQSARDLAFGLEMISGASGSTSSVTIPERPSEAEPKTAKTRAWQSGVIVVLAAAI